MSCLTGPVLPHLSEVVHRAEAEAVALSGAFPEPSKPAARSDPQRQRCMSPALCGGESKKVKWRVVVWARRARAWLLWCGVVFLGLSGLSSDFWLGHFGIDSDAHQQRPDSFLLPVGATLTPNLTHLGPRMLSGASLLPNAVPKAQFRAVITCGYGSDLYPLIEGAHALSDDDDDSAPPVNSPAVALVSAGHHHGQTKALLPVAGRRMIDWVLDAVEQAGVFGEPQAHMRPAAGQDQGSRALTC